MEQLVAIVAVCRHAFLKRMLATPLTLLVAYRVREQVKVQVQRSRKMKIWSGSRTQRANKLNSPIVSYKERFRRCFVTERKRQWEVREALKAINQGEEERGD